MRVHTLDTEIHHLMDENLERMGQWLARKTQQCNSCHSKACEQLEHCGKTLDLLREQWCL